MRRMSAQFRRTASAMVIAALVIAYAPRVKAASVSEEPLKTLIETIITYLESRLSVPGG